MRQWLIREASTLNSDSFFRLRNILHSSVSNSSLICATLHNPHDKKDELTKVTIRAIKLKGKLYYQVTSIRNRQAFDENMIPDDSFVEHVSKLILKFRQAVIHTQNTDIYVSKKLNEKELIFSEKKPTRNSIDNLALEHNRKRKYILEEGIPVPFLVHLGVMNNEGKVLSKKYDKFKQINRFVELVQDIVPHLPQNDVLHIIDFGCGKAYLTFALYHYLVNILNRKVDIVGLDLKKDVINECNQIAKILRYDGLRFDFGDIQHYEASSKVDMVVTLHACNMATDMALERAIAWKADVILSVPCCHHELYTQIESKYLGALLKHGILKERFSSLVTDALRAQILEILGYKAQVLEFIDMEHTAKNIIIRAYKRKTDSMLDMQRKVEEYISLRDSISARPKLESLLDSRLKTIINENNKMDKN